MAEKTIRILGTRGVPAAHGGFETFAEHLALYLVSHGWRVVVYCQEDGVGAVFEDVWQGVERVHIPVEQSGPKGTIVFDWQATAHAAQYSYVAFLWAACLFRLFRLLLYPMLLTLSRGCNEHTFKHTRTANG